MQAYNLNATYTFNYAVTVIAAAAGTAADATVAVAAAVNTHINHTLYCLQVMIVLLPQVMFKNAVAVTSCCREIPCTWYMRFSI